MQIVIMLSVVMMMMSVVMLNVVMLSVIMLNVVAPLIQQLNKLECLSPADFNVTLCQDKVAVKKKVFFLFSFQKKVSNLKVTKIKIILLSLRQRKK